MLRELNNTYKIDDNPPPKHCFGVVNTSGISTTEALYTRQPDVIRQQMEVAKDQNKAPGSPREHAVFTTWALFGIIN